ATKAAQEDIQRLRPVARHPASPYEGVMAPAPQSPPPVSPTAVLPAGERALLPSQEGGYSTTQTFPTQRIRPPREHGGTYFPRGGSQRRLLVKRTSRMKKWCPT